MQKSLPVNGAGLLIGLGCSILGGYVAAGQAGHDELLNGACSSAFCLLIGLLNFDHGMASLSSVMQVALLLASPACGLVGGYLQLIRQRRSAPLRVT